MTSVSVLKEFFIPEHRQIIDMQVAKIPNYLYPSPGTTVESMKQKLRLDDFLDVEHHSRSKLLLQENFSGSTPRRRFQSLLVKGPCIYNGEDGKDGVGKGIVRCYHYPAKETKPNCNRCRPMRNVDYASVLTIW
jgi:hypothetical protein